MSVVAGDALYAYPFVYPVRPHVTSSLPPSQPKLAVLITPPNKDPAIRRKYEDVVLPKGHILHVDVYITEVNRDRHGRELIEERLLPGSAAPAVKIASLCQSGEGISAGRNLHNRSRWKVV